MAIFDLYAQAERFSPSTTVEESLQRFTNLFRGLIHGGELKSIFLFATEGPDARLVVVMDSYLMGLQRFQVIDGPVFLATNLSHITELLGVTDEYQEKLLAEDEQPILGPGQINGLKVLYFRKPVPRTEDKDPLDAAKELLTIFWKSPTPIPSSQEFLRLFGVCQRSCRVTSCALF